MYVYRQVQVVDTLSIDSLLGENDVSVGGIAGNGDKDQVNDSTDDNKEDDEDGDISNGIFSGKDDDDDSNG